MSTGEAKVLGSTAEEGESPVVKPPDGRILSRTGHEKSCLKLGRPLSKAKYTGDR